MALISHTDTHSGRWSCHRSSLSIACCRKWRQAFYDATCQRFDVNDTLISVFELVTIFARLQIYNNQIFTWIHFQPWYSSLVSLHLVWCLLVTFLFVQKRSKSYCSLIIYFELEFSFFHTDFLELLTLRFKKWKRNSIQNLKQSGKILHSRFLHLHTELELNGRSISYFQKFSMILIGEEKSFSATQHLFQLVFSGDNKQGHTCETPIKAHWKCKPRQHLVLFFMNLRHTI